MEKINFGFTPFIAAELNIAFWSNFLGAVENLRTYYSTEMIINNPVSAESLYRGLEDRDYQRIPVVL